VKSKKGAVAVTLAVAMIPLIFAAGAAVDLSRAYVVKQRLRFALDAAGLAVGASSGTESELESLMQTYFDKNYPNDAMGEPVSLTMESADNIITLTATRKIDTTFMKIAGIGSMNVYAESEVTRETTGLEVVLVLDNTGSMASSGKMDAMKQAATDLVNILFGTEEVHPKLKIGLVPYAATVNIGTDQRSYVDFSDTVLTGNDATDEATYGSGKKWGGCVRSRPYPYSTNDDSVGDGGLFPAYVWPMEPRYRGTTGTYSSYCQNPSNSTGTNWYYSSRGPNYYCTERPILPLTNVKQELLDGIDAMVSRGNTQTHMGLIWGLRVVSPEEPFTEGVDWGDEEWNKVIIVLTDGVNTLSTNSSYCYSSTTTRPGPGWESGGPYSRYSGQGYVVDDNTMDLPLASNYTMYTNARNNLNTLTGEICENIKDKDILLYTITFQLSNSTTQALFRNCATDEDKFFNSPDNSELQSTFRSIGAELSNLRVSK
jgi:Flp pilus assembly protein TadG